MLADPSVVDAYRQLYQAGYPEDLAVARVEAAHPIGVGDYSDLRGGVIVVQARRRHRHAPSTRGRGGGTSSTDCAGLIAAGQSGAIPSGPVAWARYRYQRARQGIGFLGEELAHLGIPGLLDSLLEGRVGGGDGQPDRAHGPAHRLGPGT